jgi:2'-5' RNA ligase
MSVLFLGIELPEQVKAALTGYLPAQSMHIRPIKPELFHLTLHYLGRSEPEIVIDAIRSAQVAERCHTFEASVERLGHFGNKEKPSVLWAGVAPSEPLSHLHAALLPVLEECHIAADTRPFRPHITLARGRWRGRPSVPESASIQRFYHRRFNPLLFSVNRFVLFESQVSDQGRAYPVIASFELQTG